VEVAPGGAALRFAWREDFAAWAEDAPKLFLDGTTHPDLVRMWAEYLEVVEVEVAAPHQRVRQVSREFGRRFFTGSPDNVRRLADLVMVEVASTDGEVLVVAQQAVVELLRGELLPRFAAGELPGRLHLAHHGAVTGLNRWERVERALIVGRPAVNRRDGERQAEVIGAQPVGVVADREDDHWPSATGGIRMDDGSGAPVRQPRHPDPLVEALRWSISEGAVLQAIGRARGVRRGAVGAGWTTARPAAASRSAPPGRTPPAYRGCARGWTPS
jgi:putative DNA primase/helicase